VRRSDGSDRRLCAIGALIAYQFSLSRRVIAVVMALGTGLRIGSVSFELIDEALKIRTVAWVALSNLPEGMASSSRLKEAKWPKSRVMLMWLAVMVVSALSAAAGNLLLDPASGRTGALVQAFAAGALLAMLADTLLPEAYAVEGVLTGPLVVTGFAISLALSAI
jgi:zinc transporter, ZIP family